MANDEEVRAMIASLSPEEREWVATQTAKWLEKFRAFNFGSVEEPPAYEAAYGVPAYRSANLWCPFLRPNGHCAAYEHRPLACRVHIAYETNEGCKDDDKRAHQKFALFPSLIENLCAKRFTAMRDGETITSDHLGILAAKELLGIDEPTKARVSFGVKGNTLTIVK